MQAGPEYPLFKPNVPFSKNLIELKTKEEKKDERKCKKCKKCKNEYVSRILCSLYCLVPPETKYNRYK